MRILVNHIWAVLAATVATSLVATSAPASAQTIENTATVSWTAGSGQFVMPSNRVQLTVDRPDATPPTLSTFVLAGSQNSGQSMVVSDTQCRTANGTIPVELGGAFSGTSLAPAKVNPASAIRAGEPLVFAVTSNADNRNATLIETMTVTIKTPGGDSEILTLSETAANSAVFAGVIRTRAGLLPP
jgi:hypothetical protein